MKIGPNLLQGKQGMGMGKKRSRSLFEVMDPKGVYRAPVGMSQETLEPAERSEEKSDAAKPAQEKPPAKETGQEDLIEPFVAVSDDKIRLVMNYQLAIMLCFAAAVLLLCAVLIGWRLGRDSAAKSFLNSPKHHQIAPGNEMK